MAERLTSQFLNDRAVRTIVDHNNIGVRVIQSQMVIKRRQQKRERFPIIEDRNDNGDPSNTNAP